MNESLNNYSTKPDQKTKSGKENENDSLNSLTIYTSVWRGLFIMSLSAAYILILFIILPSGTHKNILMSILLAVSLSTFFSWGSTLIFKRGQRYRLTKEGIFILGSNPFFIRWEWMGIINQRRIGIIKIFPFREFIHDYLSQIPDTFFNRFKRNRVANGGSIKLNTFALNLSDANFANLLRNWKQKYTELE